MAYDPFFGGGNGTNQILPKRPSKQPQGPGPLRVPDVQMGQPQVAPYAAPYAQPGSSPIQYPAPQTYNRPLTITAAMMQQSPWTQGSRQPFPAPNAPNRLGRLGQTGTFAPGMRGYACQTGDECGSLGQCMRGLCEPRPEVMGAAYNTYSTSPRTDYDDCYTYEVYSGGLCILPPSLAAEVLPKTIKCGVEYSGSPQCPFSYLRCDSGLCVIDSDQARAVEKTREQAPPKKYRTRDPEPAKSAYGDKVVFGPGADRQGSGLRNAGQSSGAVPVNPATGMTEAEMEAATQQMDDKLICRILTARKTKSGTDSQSREYIEVIAPYADAVAQKREICDYEPKVADVIKLPVGAGRSQEAPRAAPPSEPVSVGTDRPGAAASSASSVGDAARAAAAA